MKKSNIIFLTAFIAVIVSFGIYFLVQLSEKSNADPVIFVPEEPLTVSVRDGDDVLLAGVIANDQEDGDLSDEILVESISPFAGDMSRTVTYAVCDRNGNVSKAVRRIFYSDYVPPRFSSAGQITVPVWNDSLVLKAISASDGAEGDISGRIMIGEHVQIDSYTGLYSVSVEVRTQSGMSEKADIAVLVAPSVSKNLPVISLDTYILYINVGDVFDAGAHLAGVSYSSGTGSLTVSGEVDTSKPGDFIVEYTAESTDGYAGHAYLTVCVR